MRYPATTGGSGIVPGVDTRMFPDAFRTHVTMDGKWEH